MDYNEAPVISNIDTKSNLYIKSTIFIESTKDPNTNEACFQNTAIYKCKISP